MHVLGSQSEVLHIPNIDTSNTEPPMEDTVEEQLDGGQIDDDVLHVVRQLLCTLAVSRFIYVNGVREN